MKTIWISALAKDQARVAQVNAVLARYGLKGAGHFWLDEPAKGAPRAALDGLLQAGADAWLILADADTLARPSIRYGLSLMAAGLRRAKPGAPVFVLWPDAVPAEPALPALLEGSVDLAQPLATWPARLVARLAKTVPPSALDYRLDVWGDEHLGQWLEIGPLGGAWQGIIVGVSGQATDAPAAIDFQAVGPLGALPEKTVLEYAQQGLVIETGGRTFQAWAVRNTIDAGHSYYARVKGCPSHLLFMPYADDDQGQATLLALA